MKGETPVAVTGGIILVAVMVIVGAVTYGYVASVTPHDRLIANESACAAGCTEQSNYSVTYPPLINDSTLACYNATGALTRGSNGNGGININNDGKSIYFPGIKGSYHSVNCTYTYDWASADQNSFWTNNIDTTGAGFAVMAVAAILLAAVGLITIVVLLKGE